MFISLIHHFAKSSKTRTSWWRHDFYITFGGAKKVSEIWTGLKISLHETESFASDGELVEPFVRQQIAPKPAVFFQNPMVHLIKAENWWPRDGFKWKNAEVFS